MQDVKKYIGPREAAEILGCSKSLLDKMRCLRSDGPQFIKVGKLVRYRVEDLHAWADAQARRSTSDLRGAA